ncbi:MAG: FAD-dependent oxidoreductase [Planctomycetes bacterium]|nr:FAD-dependent oxidoreductase [Planctomycetota bacterium]
MKTYDVLVLGGGTAGTAAAKAAHDAGARVALFNDGELGGLCILRGCMPTKTLLHSAQIVHYARHHGAAGIGPADLAVDFAAIMANKDAKVARFQAAKIASVETGGYEVIDARARFTGPDEVEAGGVRYRFTEGAVIATGSVQRRPELPGLDSVRVMTSDDLMRLERAPESLVVLGSGPVGLEFAQFFARLGTEVEIVTRRPILADLDPLISAEMTAAMREQPSLRLHDDARALRVSSVDGGVELLCEHRGAQFRVSGDHLVLATGRIANLRDLGLDAAGVTHDAEHIACDASMRTSNPRVFVAGDATGDRLLLHIANQEGRAAGLGAAGRPVPNAVDDRLHLEVIFFDPPVATVGLNEATARAAGHDVVTAVARLAETGRAITMDVRHGIMKLVADRPTGRILGAQLLAPRADDIVHVLAAIIALGGSAEQMVAMPWYHPTLTEVLLSLARSIEAARSRS